MLRETKNKLVKRLIRYLRKHPTAASKLGSEGSDWAAIEARERLDRVSGDILLSHRSKITSHIALSS